MVAELGRVPPALAAARVEIDSIDSQLIALLKARFAVAERVVGIKREAGLPALLQDRVDEVIANVKARAAAEGVPPEVAEALWRQLIAATIAYEERHLGPSQPD